MNLANEPMIAFLINELDVRGGTHKQLLQLIDYAASTNTPFKIFTTRYDAEKTYQGFKRHEHNIIVISQPNSHNTVAKIYNRLRFALKLRRQLKGFQAINVHDLGFELYYLFFPRKRTIWQINDMPPCFKVGVSKNVKITQIKRKSLQTIIKIGVQHAIREITVNVTKNKIRAEQQFTVPVNVLYCGIDTIRIQKNIEDSIDRFNKKQINLLSSGVFFPYRNYETQIKIIEILRQYGIDVNLKIIGSTTTSPQYTDTIKRLIANAQLTSNITICGSVDEEMFNQLHQQADMFIFINIDQSWGLAIFEAMSCGLPVIVSESVGATEILSDQHDALIVNPLDAKNIANIIIDLMTQPERYKQLSQNAINFTHKYTWEKSYSIPMLQKLQSNN